MKAVTRKRLLFVAIMAGAVFLWHSIVPAPRWELYHEDEWTRISAQGVREMQSGNVDQASDLFARAFSLIENIPPTDIRRGTTLQNLAWVEQQRRHFDRAADLYRQSITILDANGISANSQKIAALNGLATVETSLGQFPDAAKYLEQAITIEESVDGPESPEVAQALHSYAGVLLVVGRTGDAAKAAQRAAAIDSENGAKWHHDATRPVP